MQATHARPRGFGPARELKPSLSYDVVYEFKGGRDGTIYSLSGI
jgi:hypothetical protein